MRWKKRFKHTVPAPLGLSEIALKQETIALLFRPALLSSHATVAAWRHCMQHVSALQACKVYVKPRNTSQDKLIEYRKGRAAQQQAFRLPCSAVMTCHSDTIVSLQAHAHAPCHKFLQSTSRRVCIPLDTTYTYLLAHT